MTVQRCLLLSNTSSVCICHGTILGTCHIVPALYAHNNLKLYSTYMNHNLPRIRNPHLNVPHIFCIRSLNSLHTTIEKLYELCNASSLELKTIWVNFLHIVLMKCRIPGFAIFLKPFVIFIFSGGMKHLTNIVKINSQNLTSLKMWFQHCNLVILGSSDSTALIMPRSLSVTRQQVEFFKDGIAFTASWNNTWWVSNNFFP